MESLDAAAESVGRLIVAAVASTTGTPDDEDGAATVDSAAAVTAGASDETSLALEETGAGFISAYSANGATEPSDAFSPLVVWAATALAEREAGAVFVGVESAG
ncbi:MAG: hypothetical protein WA450_20090, partial [Candidatus Acidiferrales bacterium]